MPARWHLFAVANYLLLIIYGFLLLLAMRFTIEGAGPDEDWASFSFFFAGLFIIVINSVLNIYIYHRHLPVKPFSPRLKIIQKLSNFIFPIVSIMMIVYFINVIPYTRGEISFGLLFLLLFTFAAGLFVLLKQLQVNKFIEERANTINDKNPS